MRRESDGRDDASARARVVVVMGVSGSGKTCIGSALAARLAVPFVDGDDLHTPRNVAKMQAGHPLDDSDRAAWLDAVADWIDRQLAAGTVGVVACSSLKRAYRDRLARRRTCVRFVFLDGERGLIARRLSGRRGHFMPPALLDSQLAALERPGPDEGAIIVGIDAEADAILGEIVERLGPMRADAPGTGLR